MAADREVGYSHSLDSFMLCHSIANIRLYSCALSWLLGCHKPADPVCLDLFTAKLATSQLSVCLQTGRWATAAAWRALCCATA